MRNLFRILCMTAYFIGMSQTAVQAQDGREIYTSKFCITCHGVKGISVAPNYPNLAGQNELYLRNQVRDIIGEKRQTKITLLMTLNPLIQQLKDEEINAVSLFLNQMK